MMRNFDFPSHVEGMTRAHVNNIDHCCQLAPLRKTLSSADNEESTPHKELQIKRRTLSFSISLSTFQWFNSIPQQTLERLVEVHSSFVPVHLLLHLRSHFLIASLPDTYNLLCPFLYVTIVLYSHVLHISSFPSADIVISLPFLQETLQFTSCFFVRLPQNGRVLDAYDEKVNFQPREFKTAPFR